MCLNHLTIGADRHWTLREAAKALPRSLRKFKRVHVVVKDDPSGWRYPTRGLSQLSQMLYVLSSSLKGTGGKLQNLCVEIERTRWRDLETGLQPLQEAMELCKGNWTTKIIIHRTSGREENDYPPVDPASASPVVPYGLDRVRNCLYYEIKLGEILGLAAGVYPGNARLVNDLVFTRRNVSQLLALSGGGGAANDRGFFVKILRDAVHLVQDYDWGPIE